MSITIRPLAVAVAVLTAGGATVAHSQPGAPITLGAVLDEVAQRNPSLDAARAAARAARERVPGMRLPPDPQVQLGWMNFLVPSLRPMDPLGMTTLQLMQMIPTAGKLGAATAAATARADARDAGIDATAYDLRDRTAMAYYDLYATEGALDVDRDTRRLMRDLADLAASMYEVGEGLQADVLRASVELARMDEEIVRMEAMRMAMVARVNALRLTPETAALADLRVPRFPEVAPSLDSLALLADATRPMLRVAREDVRTAQANVSLARREIWPDLQAGVQVGRQAGAMGVQTMGSLMIGASLPVFAGSRQLRMRDEADAMRAMANADLAAMRADTRGSVAERHADLMRARRLAAFYRASVLPQADAAATSALAAYRAGAASFETALDARMSLNRYRRELFTLEADEGRAWAGLEMLTGHELLDTHTAQPLRRAAGESR